MTTDLPAAFDPVGNYAADTAYDLLPFNFLRLDSNRVLLTSLAGEYVILPALGFEDLTRGTLTKTEDDYKELLAKHIVCEKGDSKPIELLNVKLQNRIKAVSNFTGLHIFVVTLRCDHSCQYCQVSRQSSEVGSFDMSREHADKAIEWAFKTPNECVKFEFQGGESLLNFELIKHIVNRANELNKEYKKDLQFVAATNLASLNDEHIRFAQETGLLFSTSLDGPSELHNANRPRPDKNSYEMAIAGINRIRGELGFNRVSALMTTTHRSLPLVREIVNTYIEHGFSGIFFRPLSPFGFALKGKLFNKYKPKDWLTFYQEGLEYIITLNKNGIRFQEYYTSILLRKMLTPYGTGYVNLQNPSGSAIGAVIFNYDGKVYESDEGRMLAEMGNHELQIGDLASDAYDSVFAGERLVTLLKETMLECSPLCSDCAYQHWCGVDVTHHIATQGDRMGHKALSSFCARHMGMFRFILDRMEGDPFVKQLFLDWAWR